MATVSGQSGAKDRHLIAAIADEDSITGLLLAGIGNVDDKGKKNFCVVNGQTQTNVIESAWQEYTERPDIAILLINQHIADKIRSLVDKFQSAFPAVLEIPSKDLPWDPEKDSVLKRVAKLRGD